MQHRTLWDLNHLHSSVKRPSVYYNQSTHLKGELGRHKALHYFSLLVVFGEISDVPTLLLQTCQPLLKASQKCLQKCILLPLPGEKGDDWVLPWEAVECMA